MSRILTAALAALTLSHVAVADDCTTAAAASTHRFSNITLKRGYISANADLGGLALVGSEPLTISTAPGCAPDLEITGIQLSNVPSSASLDLLQPEGTVQLAGHILLGRQGDPSGRVYSVDGTLTAAARWIDVGDATGGLTLGLQVLDLASTRTYAGYEIRGFTLPAQTTFRGGLLFFPDLTFTGIEPDEID